RELIDVGAGTRAGGLGGDGGYDLGVLDLNDVGDGLDDRRGRLTTTGDHVDVVHILQFIQVHRGAQVGADGGWGQIDGADARLAVLGGIGLVCAGGGAFKHQIRQRVLLQQPVHALVGGDQTLVTGTDEPVGARIDADHVDRFDAFGILEQLDHQVGTDVSRSDYGGLEFGHEGVLFLARQGAWGR